MSGDAFSHLSSGSPHSHPYTPDACKSIKGPPKTKALLGHECTTEPKGSQVKSRPSQKGAASPIDASKVTVQEKPSRSISAICSRVFQNWKVKMGLELAPEVSAGKTAFSNMTSRNMPLRTDINDVKERISIFSEALYELNEECQTLPEKLQTNEEILSIIKDRKGYLEHTLLALDMMSKNLEAFYNGEDLPYSDKDINDEISSRDTFLTSRIEKWEKLEKGTKAHLRDKGLTNSLSNLEGSKILLEKASEAKKGFNAALDFIHKSPSSAEALKAQNEISLGGFTQIASVTSHMDQAKLILDKINTLKERNEAGEEIPLKDMVQPHEAGILDEFICAKSKLDTLSFQGVQGETFDQVHDLATNIVDALMPIPSGKQFSQSSVFFQDYKATEEYMTHKPMSRGAKFCAWVYRQFTGGEERHAGIILPKKGEATLSHVTGHYESETIPRGLSMLTSSTSYNVDLSELVSPKASKLAKEKGIDLQDLWDKASEELHTPLESQKDKEKIFNSPLRQINAGVTLNRHRGNDDFQEWRHIPSDRKKMICSEFTIISMIVTTNRFNDLLEEKLGLPKGGEKLADLGLPKNLQLQAVHPPYILKLLAQGKNPILKPMKMPEHLQGIIAPPRRKA